MTERLVASCDLYFKLLHHAEVALWKRVKRIILSKKAVIGVLDIMTEDLVRVQEQDGFTVDLPTSSYEGGMLRR